MRPSPQFSRFLGASWSLLSEDPIELAPVDDQPPFPSRMLSITLLPRALSTEESLGVLQEIIAPMRWDGELHGGLVGHSNRCALMLVKGNPITGDILFVARPFAEDGTQALLIFETSSPDHIARYEATVQEIDTLRWPLLVDEERGSYANDPASEAASAMRSSLAPLLGALHGELYDKADKALSEPNLLQRYIALSIIFGRAVTLPAFVEALDPASGRLLLRLAEGVCAMFSRLQDSELQHYAANLLARVLVAHPEPDLSRCLRAATLSVHVIERVRGVHDGRWEEAMLSYLFARASLASQFGDDDYGAMAALVSELQRNEHGAARVLERLALASSLAGVRRHSGLRALRLACCDLAMSLMQWMELESSPLLLRDHDDGKVNVDEQEFDLFAPPTPDADMPRANFSDALVAAFYGGRDEVARYYDVDLQAERVAAATAVTRLFPDGKAPPELLFLRSFRSSKRVWLDNTFSFDSRWVLPYLKEPARLSLEAALVKGLGSYACSAIGGLQDPLGMTRISAVLGRDLWKEAFVLYLQRVELIVALPDETEALAWELNYLVEQKALDRVLLIMMPHAVDARGESAWEHWRAILAASGAAIPPYDPAGGFVKLDDNGHEFEWWPFEALMSGRLIDALVDRRGPGVPSRE